jgi:hypothetical protein
MERLKKASAVTGLALLIVFLACGCSLFLKDDLNAGEQTGWYIKLNIHGPPASKGISVSEYEVTGLVIKVRDPADELIRTIKWEVAEGSTSYKIPVTQQGLHKIVVTHIGTKDSQVVEAKESATFDIKPMVITVIDVTPGCVGLIRVNTGVAPSIVGTWWMSSGAGGAATDITFTIKDDASLVQTYEQNEGSNLQVGTLSPANMPANTTLTYTLTHRDGPAVPPPSRDSYYFRYSNLTDTNVDLEVKMELGDEWMGPFTLQRQASSIVGTWSCASLTADGLTMAPLAITINADTSFSVSYTTSDINTQTGTLYPYTMNADTDLTATVTKSEGPDVPTPGTHWHMKYSSLSATSVGVELDLMSDGFEGPFILQRQ